VFHVQGQGAGVVGQSRSHAYWVALSDFTHATKCLKHLELGEQELCAEAMVSFLNCLYGQLSISKLTLFECLMKSDDMLLFRQFMSTPKESGASGAPPLCELVFHKLNKYEDAPWAGSSFAAMFWDEQNRRHLEDESLQSNPTRCSTVGSQIRSLTLTSVDCAGSGFLAALAQNAHHTGLTSLDLYGFEDQECCMDLAHYISKSLLKELKLDGEIGHLTPILCSLQRNGSLRSVEIPYDGAARLASSFCLRNRQLHHMLLKMPWVASDQGDNNAESTQCPLVLDRDAIPLLPTLLQCAKQISAVHASVVLTTMFLLDHGDSL
jgi:hypothetical protein